MVIWAVLNDCSSPTTHSPVLQYVYNYPFFPHQAFLTADFWVSLGAVFHFRVFSLLPGEEIYFFFSKNRSIDKKKVKVVTFVSVCLLIHTPIQLPLIGILFASFWLDRCFVSDSLGWKNVNILWRVNHYKGYLFWSIQSVKVFGLTAAWVVAPVSQLNDVWNLTIYHSDNAQNSQKHKTHSTNKFKVKPVCDKEFCVWLGATMVGQNCSKYSNFGSSSQKVLGLKNEKASWKPWGENLCHWVKFLFRPLTWNSSTCLPGTLNNPL